MRGAHSVGGVALICILGCDDNSGKNGSDAIVFPLPGSLGASSGRGGFRFGVATAATQIEDQNPSTDWYLYTKPEAEGGLGNGTFVAEASGGFSLASEDIERMESLGLDSYRFSVEWARVEPTLDQVDEAALDHYDRFLDELAAKGIHPNITIHHFSNPVWVDDPRHTDCSPGPTDENLCGFGHPEGGDRVVEEIAEHAQLLASRFGDRVDDWATVNEPVNYLVAAYGIGMFPPGKRKIFDLEDEMVPVFRDYLRAHVAMYRAIHAADTVDADGDGVAANVGVAMSVADWVPSKDNRLSRDPVDVMARDRLIYVFHYLFVDSLLNGTFDTSFDGAPDESHPDWKGTLDYAGIQYYFRAGVTGTDGAIPVLDLTPCFAGFDFGACVPPNDPTFCVPEMQYEFYAPGLYGVLIDLSQRWPDLPLVITEGGIATEVSERRAENIVRTLEQIHRAREEGADVRGYYHWSLLDNFEWAEGYGPRFGLYRVDYDSGNFERTPTLGAEVYRKIIQERTVTEALRTRYGGDGPMTPEGALTQAGCAD